MTFWLSKSFRTTFWTGNSIKYRIVRWLWENLRSQYFSGISRSVIARAYIYIVGNRQDFKDAGSVDVQRYVIISRRAVYWTRKLEKIESFFGWHNLFVKNSQSSVTLRGYCIYYVLESNLQCLKSSYSVLLSK